MRIGFMVITLVAATTAGCHVTSRIDETIAGESRMRPRPGTTPRTLDPAVTVTESGRLRFAEPQVCINDVVVAVTDYQTTKKRPNLATFIVGALVLSLGGVATVVGLAEDEDVLTAVGGLGVVVGLPLSIGPFFGNSSARTMVGEREDARSSKPVACGDRPLRGSAAMVRLGDLQLLGSVDDDGRFSVSPFTVVDAFNLGKLPALDLKIEIFSDDGGRRSFRALIDNAALVVGRAGYLAEVEVDGRVERLRKVPRVEPTDITITRRRRNDQAEIRIAVAFTNHGPGDAWGVRGVLSSRDSGIEGRIVYVGHLPAKTTTTRTTTIAMTSDSADLTEARISVVALDAHATTSMVPIRFRGPVLTDE